MDPLVTTIIPHRSDRPDFLELSLRSALTQTVNNIAVVLVDDASKDERWQTVADQWRGDSRLSVWRTNKNVGPYRIKNAMLQRTRGRYVAFQDADDWSSVVRLEKQLGYLSSKCADIVGTFFEYVDVAGQPIRHKRMWQNVNRRVAWRRGFSMLHPTMMATRAALEWLGGFDGTTMIAGDDEFLLRASHRFKIRNVPEFLYSYRLHANALTQARNTGHRSPKREAYLARVLNEEKSRRFLGFSVARDFDLASRPNDVDFAVERLW